ncbi:hypothetical protein GCM10023169_16020 [Georgenia halophila]|uniref:Polysaccharide chain length determinant N-terminal domain-containing protein n=1 Tax=Georgenia halophila TaxID=620889 RepID=A0ABP8L4U6_9MICO
MTFLEYLVLLQRRWRIWVSAVLIGVLVALTLNLLAEKQYTAMATSFVTVAEVDPAGSGEIFQGSQFAVQRMASYSALSSSPAVLDSVIEELDLDVSTRGLRQMIDVTSPAGSVLLEVSVQDTDPQRSALIANEVSHQLGAMIEELETPRGLAASTVKVTMTKPADVPVTPSSPRAVLNLLLGVVAGGSIGLVIALLRHHFDRRVKTVDDIRDVTGVMPLGSTVGSKPVERDRLAAMNYRSPEAERYRSIKATLKLTDADQEASHFAVATPTGEDETHVAANLAISWALTGAKVCLVDANLRHPTISQAFSIDTTVGLSDVLVGDVGLDTALTSREEWGVTILPAGYLPLDPADLLGSQEMELLIADLRSRFDVVIYSAGAMLDVSDAIVVARALDGVVLVVRAGKTTMEQLEACLETGRETRLTLLGTVRAGVGRRDPAARRVRAVTGDVHRTPLPDQQNARLRA